MSMRSAGWAATAVVVLALVGCGGGGGGDIAGKTGVGAGATTKAPAGGKGEPAAHSVASPRPLPGDPCALVTEAEAAKAVGAPLKQDTATTDGSHVCRYFGDGIPQGRLKVDTAPAFCALLYLALEKNMFGHGSGRGVQLRIDDIGDGGMLVQGNGNVQIAVGGGCLTIDASTGEVPVADATMLSLARTAVGRLK